MIFAFITAVLFLALIALGLALLSTPAFREKRERADGERLSLSPFP